MKNQIMGAIKPYLPERITRGLEICSDSMFGKLRELRFKVNDMLLADVDGRITRLCDIGRITSGELAHMVSKITRGSMYSVNDTIVDGFVTLPGGYRVGFCGTAVISCGKIIHIKDISALNIRISRQVNGCSIGLLKEVFDNTRIKNILIASAPGCGKTTLITDLCRVLGSGAADGVMHKVGIADERSEIAAVCNGIPGHDIGTASFVFNGYPKSECIRTMLRTMSPEVIVTDEIGGSDDFNAVIEALRSGVSVIATAHAHSIDDLYFRFTDELIKSCFETVVFLSDKCCINKIYRRDDNDN